MSGALARLTVTALEHRADDIEKVAKKAEEEKYVRQGREMKADAATIRELILPRFKEQAELPLATPVEVRAAIANQLRFPVQKLHAGKKDLESFLNGVAYLVEQMLSATSERAYTAGVQAREHQTELVILHALASTNLKDAVEGDF